MAAERKPNAVIYAGLLRAFTRAKTPTPDFREVANLVGCTYTLAKNAWEIGFPSTGPQCTPIRERLYADLDRDSLVVVQFIEDPASIENIELVRAKMRARLIEGHVQDARISMHAQAIALDLGVAATEILDAAEPVREFIVNLLKEEIEKAKIGASDVFTSLVSAFAFYQRVLEFADRAVSIGQRAMDLEKARRLQPPPDPSQMADQQSPEQAEIIGREFAAMFDGMSKGRSISDDDIDAWASSQFGSKALPESTEPALDQDS